MSLLQSILMGLIQGLTEFLPVSSSGHLALFKILFHVETDTGMFFDVLLHVGTLAAVCLIYYKDIFHLIKETVCIIADYVYNLRILIGKMRHVEGRYRRIVCNSYRKFVLMILVSTIPTGIIGYVAADLVEMASEILLIPGICLVITAVILFICDYLPDGKKRPKEVSWTNAFLIGICQGIATFPGISRSGTTITACVACGFDRKFAVKYSFILSIPAILGAMLLEVKDAGSMAVSSSQVGIYVVGMLVAAVVGYICIKTMFLIARNKKFKFFAFYCLAVGLLSIGGYIYLA
ncbi:MAG: undecaprenyl-diphosphate phosphatase [Clostridiales bacterium]|nr:undecaprenyl-diphosphate phosphatase [Clostridiales bacterium]